VTIRARGAFRPLAGGVALLVLYALLEPRSLREALRDPARAIGRLAPWIVVTLALVTTIDAIRYGAFVASGSDSYGYLSEAYGWAGGHLPRPYDIPLSLPLPSSDWLQTPLGYWPGRTAHTIVPSYAPGFPLLMAMAVKIANPVGPYLVVPLCAGLFVWVTFLLARRIAGPVAGLVAAALAATSPTVLFLSLWVMSDVPAGVMWTAAAAAALADSRRGAVGAGIFTALGLLIRPNLAPLALVPFAWIVFTARGGERVRRAALFCAFVGPTAIAIGILNTAWYGSPFLSGYGDPSLRFGYRYLWPNLQRYPVWLVQSQSPWIVVAFASLLASRRSSLRAPVAFAWTFVLVTLLCYIAYVAYDEWWYLRFLLPGLGVFFALVAVGLWTIADRVPRPWGRVLATAILALILWHSIGFVAAQNMFGPFKASEHRYADLGAFIAKQFEPDAVFFAMQHTGAIRYYGGRHTLRYDLLSKDWATRAPAAIESLGLHPYLAIDDAELPDVRKAFRLAADGPPPWPLVARMNTFGVSIYDLGTRPSSAPPMAIELRTAPPYSAPVEVVIQPRAR
jgi:Dolichyl-phosphate-mannose-protein mannosyltransferase